MSHSVKGTVDNSYNKQKTSKAGKNFTINYVEVDGVTFSTGFDKKFSNGEYIDVAVEKKFGEWQYTGQPGGSLPAAGSAPAPVKGNFGGGAKGLGSFPIDPKSGQISIIRQSSMNRATEIMGQLVTAKIITPKTKEEYMDMLVNIALEITDFGSGNDITKLMKDQTAMKEAVNG